MLYLVNGAFVSAAAGAQLNDFVFKFPENKSFSCQKNKTKDLVYHMVEDIPALAKREGWL